MHIYFIKGTISIAPQTEDNANNGDKEVAYKNCAPFTDCISEINNTQIDNAKDIDVLMPMYNLTNGGAISNFHAVNNSASLKFEQTITGKAAAANGRKGAEIMVPLKYLSNFSRTVEMP